MEQRVEDPVRHILSALDTYCNLGRIYANQSRVKYTLTEYNWDKYWVWTTLSSRLVFQRADGYVYQRIISDATGLHIESESRLIVTAIRLLVTAIRLKLTAIRLIVTAIWLIATAILLIVKAIIINDYQ